MKKVFVLLLALWISTSTYNTVLAQENDSNTIEQTTDTTPVEQNTATIDQIEADPVQEEEIVSRSAHQIMKKNFIDGGWGFMSIVLVCLILGLAVAIERIITLSLATINTKKLVIKLEEAIVSGDIDEAVNICKSTPGPTAEVLGQGLRRADGTTASIEAVEKAIIANGSVQMGLLEKGLVWLALFIALAPMLGFMGTVIGMIDAFDTIQQAGDIDPAMVAGGIKVALLTTVFGLITAIILQVFYNYITAKVDNLVNTMEDATISVIDILIDNGTEVAAK